MEKPAYTLKDLLYLMARLRQPETGCPWDIKQTWETIPASTIEEAYEVVDAIESGDRNKIKEELGDLLFQVIFYCQFAREEGAFEFEDVVDTIVAKLVSRHPHVFPCGELYKERPKDELIDENSVNKTWEEIKKNERLNRGQQGLLAEVAVNLPAITRAEKLQKRVSRVGLDWPNGKAVIAKFREELDELERAIDSGNKDELEEELGDLLFTGVNFARLNKLDGEQALRKANRKFENRVAWLETQLAREGKTVGDCDQLELDTWWERAKKAGL